MRDDLRKTIEDYRNKLLNPLKFVRYDEEYTDLGALMKFKNKFLKIQIVNDRDYLSLEISSKYGKENFQFIVFIKNMIDLKALEKDKSSDEKIKLIFSTPLSFDVQVEYFINNIDKLIILFDKYNYQQTLRKLDEIGEKRGKIMFGL